MSKPLKTYTSVAYAVREMGEALGTYRKGNSSRQIRVIVAARSWAEARVLFGLNTGDIRHSGSIITRECEEATLTLAEPGQVFARWYNVTGEGHFVRAGCGSGHRWTLYPDVRTTLETAEWLLAKEREEREAKATREAEREAERTASAQRRAEGDARALEALERLRPALVAEGIHPATVQAKGQGVWLPPEVAETLADLLAEFQSVRELA